MKKIAKRITIILMILIAIFLGIDMGKQKCYAAPPTAGEKIGIVAEHWDDFLARNGRWNIGNFNCNT